MDLLAADIEPGIGRAVGLLRVRAGLTRDELATKAVPPLSRSTVLKIEKGERVPNADTLKRLAHGLNITSDELLVASWICAEEDAAKRAERAERASAGIAAGIFGEPSAVVRAGALAGLGVIALLGAPIAVGAAAAAAAGGLVHERERKAREAREVELLQAEIQRRVGQVTDPNALERLLDSLPVADDDAG